MKHDDFTWDDIILEAPGDELDDELSATDYTNTDVEEAEPASDDPFDGDPADDDPLGDEGDGESTDDDPFDGDPADDDPLDDEGDTESTDDDPLGEDPADDDPLSDDNPEGDTDTTTDEEQTDNAENDVISDKQNINLVNDFIELYNRIDEIMNQIRTDCKTNIRYNPNMQVVRRNLTKLKEITYDYITNKFSKESYVANLYQFNLIIQALNVNIDLLSSVMASNKQFNEKNAKKTNKKADNKKK